jgi:flagellar biosynthesis anti-sigma factor FlgM
MNVERGWQVRAGGLSGSKMKVEGGTTADKQEGAAGVDAAQADLAGLMARLVKGIRDAPEDGAGRVAALRQSIAAGSYQVPASAVAEKLIETMLVEDERS